MSCAQKHLLYKHKNVNECDATLLIMQTIKKINIQIRTNAVIVYRH